MGVVPAGTPAGTVVDSVKAMLPLRVRVPARAPLTAQDSPARAAHGSGRPPWNPAVASARAWAWASAKLDGGRVAVGSVAVAVGVAVVVGVRVGVGVLVLVAVCVGVGVLVLVAVGVGVGATWCVMISQMPAPCVATRRIWSGVPWPPRWNAMSNTATRGSPLL